MTEFNRSPADEEEEMGWEEDEDDDKDTHFITLRDLPSIEPPEGYEFHYGEMGVCRMSPHNMSVVLRAMDPDRGFREYKVRWDRSLGVSLRPHIEFVPGKYIHASISLAWIGSRWEAVEWLMSYIIDRVYDGDPFILPDRILFRLTYCTCIYARGRVLVKNSCFRMNWVDLFEVDEDGDVMIDFNHDPMKEMRGLLASIAWARGDAHDIAEESLVALRDEIIEDAPVISIDPYYRLFVVDRTMMGDLYPQDLREFIAFRAMCYMRSYDLYTDKLDVKRFKSLILDDEDWVKHLILASELGLKFQDGLDFSNFDEELEKYEERRDEDEHIKDFDELWFAFGQEQARKTIGVSRAVDFERHLQRYDRWKDGDTNWYSKRDRYCYPRVKKDRSGVAGPSPRVVVEGGLRTPTYVSGAVSGRRVPVCMGFKIREHRSLPGSRGCRP